MNPYEELGPTAFWKKAVANNSFFNINDIWIPKFNIKKNNKIATYGSCFAQHIARNLRAEGYGWLNSEPAPRGLSDESKKDFNYDVYSSRSGNIYTSSFLLQTVRFSFGLEQPPLDVWINGNRFIDPLRPSVEPDGFVSKDELFRSRAVFLDSFKQSVISCDILIFTLGLTESWFDERGFEYPVCPGTLAGEFDPRTHVFKNQDYSFVRRNLLEALKLMREQNPRLRVLLTVSPVPLTATNSGDHVLQATTYSKSTLRAVAGDLSKTRKFIDYFPSYELITTPHNRGVFYDANARTVVSEGVGFVMSHFFKAIGAGKESKNDANLARENDEVLCDEEVLESFSSDRKRK